MKYLNSKQILFLFCLLFSTVALSDEVYLNNGDRLSGTIVNKTNDMLKIETRYAGVVEIQWSDISHLITDQTVQVLLNDETKIQGTLYVIDETEQHIELEKDAKSKELNIQQIAAINPPEEPKFIFSGQINFSGEIDRGNTDEDDYHLNAETELRWPKDRLLFFFEGDYEEKDGSASKQEVDFGSYYDHFLTEKWFAFAGFELEHDRFADLDLRTTIGGGPGYQFFETMRTNLNLITGPGYVWENFDEGEDSNYPVALWGLRFDHYLFEKSKYQVFHNHRFTQSLDDGDDFIFKSKTGLRMSLTDHLQASLQYNFDWDNAPGEDAKEDDRETLITAGFKW